MSTFFCETCGSILDSHGYCQRCHPEMFVPQIDKKYQARCRHSATKYIPSVLKYLFITEAFPSSQKFFYFEDTHVTPLFTTLVQAIYGFYYQPRTSIQQEEKTAILSQFQTDGYYLFNAIEFPIDQGLDEKKKPEFLPHAKREEVIRFKQTEIIQRLDNLVSEEEKKTVQLILLKKSVFNGLTQALKKENYRVLNQEHIPFPYWKSKEETGNIDLVVKRIRQLIPTLPSAYTENEPVTYMGDWEVIRETEKAVLLHKRETDREMWLPKSKTIIHKLQTGQTLVILPRWLAEKRRDMQR